MTEQFRNDGARRMTESKLPIRQISRELGVNASTVSRWASGDRQPEPDHARELARRYGIPAGAWGRAVQGPASPLPPVPEAARDVLASVMEHLPDAAPPAGLVVAALAELEQLAADLEGDPAAEELAAAVVAARAELPVEPVPSWGSVLLVGLVAVGAPGAAAAVARALRAVEGLA
jgi:transcriptional regulator with XRE-family HTH domain